MMTKIIIVGPLWFYQVTEKWDDFKASLCIHWDLSLAFVHTLIFQLVVENYPSNDQELHDWRFPKLEKNKKVVKVLKLSKQRSELQEWNFSKLINKKNQKKPPTKTKQKKEVKSFKRLAAIWAQHYKVKILPFLNGRMKHWTLRGKQRTLVVFVKAVCFPGHIRPDETELSSLFQSHLCNHRLDYDLIFLQCRLHCYITIQII